MKMTLNRPARGKLLSLGLLLTVLALTAGHLRGPDASSPAGSYLAFPGGLGHTDQSSSYEGSVPLRDLGNGIAVGLEVKHDQSPPLRDLKPLPPSQEPIRRPEEAAPSSPVNIPAQPDVVDPVVQRSFGPLSSPHIPGPLLNWNGINQAQSGCGPFCIPSDANGDVGPNHYIQTVNLSFSIFNKSGNLIYGPAEVATLWNGFGGPCQTYYHTDPIVLYDPLANRWLMSQVTFGTTPYDACIAVSATADPAGSWYRYAFQLASSPLSFPDYPKLGVWPDGYYMSVEQVDNFGNMGQAKAGPRPYVFERSQMLLGNAANFQTTSNALTGNVGMLLLPSDQDGPTPPPAGQANVFVGLDTKLELYKFHVDWTPGYAGTTWSGPIGLVPTPFLRLCPGNPNLPNCLAQKGTPQKLDGMGDRLMNRLAYRNRSGIESLVVNHAVNVGTSVNPQAGVRWYEIRNPASAAPTINGQASYAPTTDNRWIGSAAMNYKGEIALAYSVASSTVFPSIRYTGYNAAGVNQNEGTLFAGSGSQVGNTRWGDYSSLSVDPGDDCTFWFTSQYNNSNAQAWSTRIGTFRITTCP